MDCRPLDQSLVDPFLVRDAGVNLVRASRLLMTRQLLHSCMHRFAPVQVLRLLVQEVGSLLVVEVKHEFQ